MKKFFPFLRIIIKFIIRQGVMFINKFHKENLQDCE